MTDGNTFKFNVQLVSFNIVHGSSRMQLILTASSEEGLEKQDLKVRKTGNYALHNVNRPIQSEERS